jgi:SnoaL-like protein
MGRTAVAVSGGLAALAACSAVFAAPPERPKACTRAEVGRLVVRFVDAFNAGNLDRLDRTFARRPDFRWYSTDAPGERYLPVASDRASLRRYFARRHARGERLVLETLKVNGNTRAAKPYGNFEFTLVRSADDLPATPYQGKGAAHCYALGSDVLIVWSMARDA